MRYLLGVDLGSGSIRAVIHALDGTQVAMASRPTEKVAPDATMPGQIVWPHDRIWANGCAAIREALGKMPKGGRIEAVAVACLGMDGLPLDADGRELYPFISWHDTRTVPQLEAWERSFGAKRQFLATGNQLYAFNTAFRLQWMAEHEPELLARADKWVLIGDYFNFKLCGRLATDYSMACCTLLFDARTCDWSPEIIEAAGIDRRLLCEPLPSGTLLGAVTAEAAKTSGLPAGTPVVLGGHDYLCGVLPVGGHKPGTIVNVAGTWDVVQTTVAKFDPDEALVGRGLTVESHVAPGAYSVFGAAVGGAVLDWYRQEFGLAYGADQQSWDAAQTSALDRDPAGLLFLPHITGANCPDLDPFAAGALIGLRSWHTKSDILAAICQGLAFQNAAIVQSLEGCGMQAERFVLVGGGARNSASVQSRADVLGRAIELCPIDETTALGAAMLAGLGAGFFPSLEHAFEAVRKPGTIVAPRPRQSATLRSWLPIYSDLYRLLQPAHHALGKPRPA